MRVQGLPIQSLSSIYANLCVNISSEAVNLVIESPKIRIGNYFRCFYFVTLL